MAGASVNYTLRPVIRPDDLPFLREVYARTRDAELAPLPWSETDKERFLALQFDYQDRHYLAQFQRAQFQIIAVGGVSAGRLYVDRRADTLHVVDLSLLPAWRGQGLGSAILRSLGAEAHARGNAVTIYVESVNPARRLYERLGFVLVSTAGLYHLMRWPAGS